VPLEPRGKNSRRAEKIFHSKKKVESWSENHGKKGSEGSSNPLPITSTNQPQTLSPLRRFFPPIIGRVKSCALVFSTKRGFFSMGSGGTYKYSFQSLLFGRETHNLILREVLVGEKKKVFCVGIGGVVLPKVSPQHTPLGGKI